MVELQVYVDRKHATVSPSRLWLRPADRGVGVEASAARAPLVLHPDDRVERLAACKTSRAGHPCTLETPPRVVVWGLFAVRLGCATCAT